MPGMRLTKFNGIRPRVAPKLLEEKTAQTAENVRLVSNRLECLKIPLVVEAVTAGRTSLYKWYRNSSSEFLSWAADVDVVRGPIADDQYERIYYTSGSGDLQIVGWDEAKETRAASMSVPSAPTVAKAQLFDLSTKVTLNIKEYNGASYVATYAATFISISLNDDIVTMSWEYDVTGLGAGNNLYPQYTVTDPTGTGTPTETDIPVDANILTRSKLYSETVALSASGAKYGELQIISHDSTPVSWDSWTGNGVFRIETQFKLNYARRTTQYQYYVQTFVDDWGQEGPPSAISPLVEWAPGEKITVTLPGTTPTGKNLSHRRIYRSAAGTKEDYFYYVGQVAESTSTFVDTLTDSELGERMPDFKNPESGMAGLIVMAGGWLAAFKDKTLYCSEPFLPNTWPSEYELTFEYDIVALAPSGNDIIVMTTGNPYIVTGSHPELLTQTRLMLNQACVSKRGVCQVGRVVVYPSPDGLVVVSGSRADVATKPFYSKEDWAALVPSSMLAEVYDKRYHGWTSAGTIIFDFDENRAAVTTTSEGATGLFNDLQSDSLYMIQGTSINKWDAGATNLGMTWRSKEFTFPRPFAPRVCRILADSFPVDESAKELTVRLYAENVLVATREVFSGDAFLLPKLKPERVWSFSVTSYDAIDEIALVTSMGELR